jgi:uncharacterized membrane protein YphA (DoxX/SURF4 family)
MGVTSEGLEMSVERAAASMCHTRREAVMNEHSSNLGQQRLITALSWLLAVSFVVGAVTKFRPGESFFGPPYSEKFFDWGYPAWFRFVVGSGEFLGAVLLIVPRRRFLGAALLVVILVGAVGTHIANQDRLAKSAAAPVVLALTGIAAWATRPRDWRGLFAPQSHIRPAIHGSRRP